MYGSQYLISESLSHKIQTKWTLCLDLAKTQVESQNNQEHF